MLCDFRERQRFAQVDMDVINDGPNCRGIPAKAKTADELAIPADDFLLYLFYTGLRRSIFNAHRVLLGEYVNVYRVDTALFRCLSAEGVEHKGEIFCISQRILLAN